MALSNVSKAETSRFMNFTRMKQNFELLDKPVLLCNKVIHACRLQSVSSFLSSSDLTSVYMMSTNDICVKVHVHFFFVIDDSEIDCLKDSGVAATAQETVTSTTAQLPSGAD